jgi:hypothetical protein
MNEDLNSPDLTISIEIMKLNQDKLWFGMKSIGGAPERWRIPDGQKRTDGSSEVSSVSDESASLDTGNS